MISSIKINKGVKSLKRPVKKGHMTTGTDDDWFWNRNLKEESKIICGGKEVGRVYLCVINKYISNH